MKTIKKLIDLIKNGWNSIVNDCRQTGNPDEDITTQTEKSVEDFSKPDSSDLCMDIVREQFLLQAKVLYGTYGSLYRAAGLQKRAESLLSDMNERISYVDGNQELKDFWDRQSRNPVALLDFVWSTGVVRDEQQFITADKETYKYYSTDNDDRIITGQKYRVIEPCWTNGETVLETGTIEAIDENE